MTNLKFIADNIDQVRAEVLKAAERANRDPGDITVIAVTKTYPAEYVSAAFHSGITDVGENRVQEALPKIIVISNDLSMSPLRWHLIGHLQSNKAKQAVNSFDLIHSVDSVKLAEEICRHAEAANRIMPVLLQVNVSGEESKGGFPAADLQAGVESILTNCPFVTIEGFMTMAPIGPPESARPIFKDLRELRDSISKNINHERFSPKELSMGMSSDYSVAIEEGATLIRVGSSIFGDRSAL